MHDLGSDSRELQHLLIGDLGDEARPRLDPGIGGVDTGHIGVDLTAFGTQLHGQRHRRGVVPPAEGGDVQRLVDALETATTTTCPLQLVDDALGNDVDDPRAAVDAARPDPGLQPVREIAGTPAVPVPSPSAEL